MSSFDDDACILSLSGTRAEASLEPRRQRQPVHGAASSPPPRAVGIRCQGYCCCRRAKAGCAHRRCVGCCRRRGFVCPAHANRLPRAPATSRCSERHQQAHAADRKRPRALPSVATPTTTTTTSSSSSVDQPTMDTAVPAGWFAREVSLDAVFRRVRLMGPDAEVAYHTTVTIAGHVFRGVLYDVGPLISRSSTAALGTDDDGSCDGSSRSTTRGSCQLDLRLSL
ncbi:hypothetical protein BS78_02G252800 [Paspalum vaginatum]|nr:hypothetical protein BS78_02G252800 [Paspalum vaginatum]